jgi:hypothetical protein
MEKIQKKIDLKCSSMADRVAQAVRAPALKA